MAAGDIKFSGAISLTTYLDTTLNSLADGAIDVGSTILDNTSNMHQNLVIELYLASADLSAVVSPSVEVYLVPSADGTNYANTGTDATTTKALYPKPTHLVANIPLMVGTGAQVHREVVVIPNFLLNLKYTPVLINKSGAAFASSGNTLKIGTNAYAMTQS